MVKSGVRMGDKESIRKATSGDKNSFYGQSHTEVTKNRMSQSGRTKIRLAVYDTELKTETIYNSIKDAAKALACARPALYYQINKGGLSV